MMLSNVDGLKTERGRFASGYDLTFCCPRGTPLNTKIERVLSLIYLHASALEITDQEYMWKCELLLHHPMKHEEPFLSKTMSK